MLLETKQATRALNSGLSGRRRRPSQESHPDRLNPVPSSFEDASLNNDQPVSASDVEATEGANTISWLCSPPCQGHRSNVACNLAVFATAIQRPAWLLEPDAEFDRPASLVMSSSSVAPPGSFPLRLSSADCLSIRPSKCLIGFTAATNRPACFRIDSSSCFRLALNLHLRSTQSPPASSRLSLHRAILCAQLPVRRHPLAASPATGAGPRIFTRNCWINGSPVPRRDTGIGIGNLPRFA